MDQKKSQFSFLLLVSDFLLLNTSYFAVNYLKLGTFKLSPAYYVKLLITFNVIWIIVSVLMKKFNTTTYKKGFKDTTIRLFNSNVIICYIVSCMVVFMGLFAFSRIHVFGTIFLLLLAEIGIFAFYYLGYGKKSDDTAEKKEVEITQKQRISTRLLIADGLLFNLSFFCSQLSKKRHLSTKFGI